MSNNLNFNLTLDADLRERIHERADALDLAATQYIRQLIRDDLKRSGASIKKQAYRARKARAAKSESDGASAVPVAGNQAVVIAAEVQATPPSPPPNTPHPPTYGIE